MKEIYKGVLIGLVTIAIPALLGYVWLIRENQIRIQTIQRDIESLSSRVERGNESLNALKLFVVSAHPDRNYISITSAGKLQDLTAGEINTLAAEIDKYSTARAFSLSASKDNPQINDIMARYQIDQNDLRNYWSGVKALKINELEKP